MSSKQVEIIKKVKRYSCDVCKEPCNSSYCKCIVCGRDICNEHTVLDPHCTSDYPDRYCEHCWSVGKSFRSTIHSKEMDNEFQINLITTAWHEKAKSSL